jgi:hypothetical protein
MSEPSNEKQPARRFDLPRLASMLIRPAQSFLPMSADKHSTWLTPMLLLSLTTILVVIVTGYLKTQAALNGVVELPPDWEFWTTEMQENYLQAQQATQSPAINYVIPMIGALFSLWLGWLIFSGIMRLVSTLLGGRGSMQSALNVVGWAGIPFAVRDVLRVLFMLSAGRAIASPGLSGFVEAGLALQFLSHTDLFMFWNIALLGIGFSVVDGLPRGKALIGAAVVVFILLAIRSAIGAAVAGFG